jgi:hypothetical protein
MRSSPSDVRYSRAPTRSDIARQSLPYSDIGIIFSMISKSILPLRDDQLRYCSQIAETRDAA